MERLAPIFLAILLSLVLPAISRDVGQRSGVDVMPEERDIITRESLDAYLATTDDNTGDIVGLAKSSLEGIGTLTQIDFSKSGGAIAWDVAKAVVPIIGSALALIPGVGVVVSGLFMGLWGLISPIFTPKENNPMEKMIKELAKKLNKETDKKLSKLVKTAIYGEISRNSYVCNKYSYISSSFIDDFKYNRVLTDMDAIKLIVYLNDCDNFLKDTAEAFGHDEYADVLWVPAAITTSVRLAFLTEVIKNGRLMGLKDNVLTMYFKDLKKDIQRHFEYQAKGLAKVHKDKKGEYQQNKNYIDDVSAVEKAACSLQSQFFYFDQEIYSYGMPTILNDTDMFADINMADYYNPDEGNTVKHLQIFFNVTKSKYPSHMPKTDSSRRPYLSLEFMNCLLGPMYLTAPTNYWFNFRPMDANKQYSYEFRVLYHETKVYETTNEEEFAVPLLSHIKKEDKKFTEYSEVNRKVNGNAEIGHKTCLNIEFVFPDHEKFSQSKKLIDIPNQSYWKTCPFETYEWASCTTFVEMFEGRFKMYSAGTLNHDYESLNSLISIDTPLYRAVNTKGSVVHTLPTGFLVGMEIILRPRINLSN